MIPYSTQTINNTDIKAVVDVLKSDFLTQGPKISQFENILSKYVGSRYCSVVNSATSALILSYSVLGIKKNDIIWTSPISFVATSNAGLILGAKIKFIDIDDSYNISVDNLAIELKKAKKLNSLPKVVTVVHMAGTPADMVSIKKLSKKYNFKIIEDASHALGASIKKKKIGSCFYSDLSIFSFHPVKMITTGEGGAITLNNKKLLTRINLLRSHGITRDRNLLSKRNSSIPLYYYEQIDLGYNFRLTDIQAALGISQMKRIDIFVRKRNQLAMRYNKMLVNLPLKLPLIKEFNQSSFHLYIVLLDNSLLRDKLYEYLKKYDIYTNVHYNCITNQPFYKKKKTLIKPLKNANSYSEKCLSLPLFPRMTISQQNKVIYHIKNFFKKCN